MKRHDFLKLIAATPLISAGMKLKEFESISDELPDADQLPALFIGHGHPMNALYDNTFTRKLAEIGHEYEQPQAIMVISAHWETKGTYVSMTRQPKTIYDFGGFDPRLFEIKYEPSGHPDFAKEVISLGHNYDIKGHDTMGLDHGAWTILKHMYPKADIPVFQLSIDHTQPAQHHYELASALKKLRKKGVLIIGSGNIVHNLGMLDWRNIDASPADWAVSFDDIIKQHLANNNFKALVDYQKLGKLAQMAIPSNDHYLPMIYTLGLADHNELVTPLFEGFQYGSISMRCFKVG